MRSHCELLFLILLQQSSSFSPSSYQNQKRSSVSRIGPGRLLIKESTSFRAELETNGLNPADHLRLLNDSLKNATGKSLPELMGKTSDTYWQDEVHMSMRYAVLSHGAVNGFDGPIKTYANFAAVAAFSYPKKQILEMPACRMARPGLDQEELTRIFLQLKEHPANCIENYHGFRCTQDQRQFYVRDAIVRTLSTVF